MSVTKSAWCEAGHCDLRHRVNRLTQAHRHRHVCTRDLYRHDDDHLLRCNVSAPKRDQGRLIDSIGLAILGRVGNIAVMSLCVWLSNQTAFIVMTVG